MCAPTPLVPSAELCTCGGAKGFGISRKRFERLPEHGEGWRGHGHVERALGSAPGHVAVTRSMARSGSRSPWAPIRECHDPLKSQFIRVLHRKPYSEAGFVVPDHRRRPAPNPQLACGFVQGGPCACGPRAQPVFAKNWAEPGPTPRSPVPGVCCRPRAAVMRPVGRRSHLHLYRFPPGESSARATGMHDRFCAESQITSEHAGGQSRIWPNGWWWRRARQNRLRCAVLPTSVHGHPSHWSRGEAKSICGQFCDYFRLIP
jgi:hypothetical protein